jgi:hypothetical protein
MDPSKQQGAYYPVGYGRVDYGSAGLPTPTLSTQSQPLYPNMVPLLYPPGQMLSLGLQQQLYYNPQLAQLNNPVFSQGQLPMPASLGSQVSPSGLTQNTQASGQPLHVMGGLPPQGADPRMAPGLYAGFAMPQQFMTAAPIQTELKEKEWGKVKDRDKDKDRRDKDRGDRDSHYSHGHYRDQPSNQSHKNHSSASTNVGSHDRFGNNKYRDKDDNYRHRDAGEGRYDGKYSRDRDYSDNRGARDRKDSREVSAGHMQSSNEHQGHKRRDFEDSRHRRHHEQEESRRVSREREKPRYKDNKDWNKNGNQQQQHDRFRDNRRGNQSPVKLTKFEEERRERERREWRDESDRDSRRVHPADYQSQGRNDYKQFDDRRNKEREAPSRQEPQRMSGTGGKTDQRMRGKDSTFMIIPKPMDHIEGNALPKDRIVNYICCESTVPRKAVIIDMVKYKISKFFQNSEGKGEGDQKAQEEEQEGLQLGLSDEEDLYHLTFKPRYYSDFIVCQNCFKEGHAEQNCPERFRQVCWMCLGNHNKEDCLNLACFRCNGSGHKNSNCVMKDPSGHPPCPNCKKKSHSEQDCSMLSLSFSKAAQDLSDVICYRCGQRGHGAGYHDVAPAAMEDELKPEPPITRETSHVNEQGELLWREDHHSEPEEDFYPALYEPKESMHRENSDALQSLEPHSK